MNRRIGFQLLGLVASGSIVTGSLAQAIVVDISQFPDGTPVPANAVITDQYRDIGILLDGRQGVAVDSPPLDQFIGGNIGANRFLFNTPDVFGAVLEYSFVVPGTATASFATFFQTSPDFDSLAESLDLIGLDARGEVVSQLTISTVADGMNPIVLLEAPAGRAFARVEVHTRGNPGIGFLSVHSDALRFTLVPEPSSVLLLIIGASIVLRLVSRQRLASDGQSNQWLRRRQLAFLVQHPVA